MIGARDPAATVLDDRLSGLGMMRRAMPEARKLIMKGCDLCPHSEDVWLEAARLQTPEHAKALLARGVSYNQTSVKLWIQVGIALTPSPQACLWQKCFRHVHPVKTVMHGLSILQSNL